MVQPGHPDSYRDYRENQEHTTKGNELLVFEKSQGNEQDLHRIFDSSFF